jgi:hypothetical protein
VGSSNRWSHGSLGRELTALLMRIGGDGPALLRGIVEAAVAAACSAAGDRLAVIIHSARCVMGQGQSSHAHGHGGDIAAVDMTGGHWERMSLAVRVSAAAGSHLSTGR